MRTTLTLDDDLAQQLKMLARDSNLSFKEVTNEVIRRGLSVGQGPVEAQPAFRVRPKACGFRAGVDPLKLNQLYDDLEIEDLNLRVHEP